MEFFVKNLTEVLKRHLQILADKEISMMQALKVWIYWILVRLPGFGQDFYCQLCLFASLSPCGKLRNCNEIESPKKTLK